MGAFGAVRRLTRGQFGMIPAALNPCTEPPSNRTTGTIQSRHSRLASSPKGSLPRLLVGRGMRHARQDASPRGRHRWRKLKCPLLALSGH